MTKSLKDCREFGELIDAGRSRNVTFFSIVEDFSGLNARVGMSHVLAGEVRIRLIGGATFEIKPTTVNAIRQ